MISQILFQSKLTDIYGQEMFRDSVKQSTESYKQNLYFWINLE